MDRASLRRDVANELLGRSALAGSSDLERYIDGALDYFGGTSMEHPEGGVVLSLSPRLATRLQTRTSSIRGVFSPSEALRLEDLDFFAFGHDLVDGIVELPLQSDAGFAPVIAGVRRLPDTTEILVEIFYEVRVGGLRPSGRIVRHVIGQDLIVHAEDVVALPGSSLPGPASAEPPDWVSSAVEASRVLFTRMLGEVRRQAHDASESIKDEETARAERIFAYLRVRLDKLVDDQRERIASMEETGTESQRKILPALEGRLTKALERRDRLTHEHERTLGEIRSREASIDAEIVAAGLVIP
jgi:hypothetical protein